MSSSSIFAFFSKNLIKKFELFFGQTREIFFLLGHVVKFSLLVLGQVATIHGTFKQSVSFFDFDHIWSRQLLIIPELHVGFTLAMLQPENVLGIVHLVLGIKIGVLL